jgi:hypothetical protein
MLPVASGVVPMTTTRAEWLRDTGGVEHQTAE